jgi:hypothetical protein
MKSKLLLSTDREYHADRTSLSSSNLKQILKDPQQFYQEWILGNKEDKKENPAFLEGKFVHTLILEEHLIEKYAVYMGLKRQGATWESFKAEHAGKDLITIAQVQRCQALFKAYSARKEAMAMISGGVSEHTMLTTILDVPIKTRADYINIDKGYIVDVKTTAYPSDIDSFREVINQYSYELSAALYCQAAYNNYGKLFDFYFIVLSKADLTCDIYKASSDTLSKGSAMVTQALVRYKKCRASGVWDVEQPREAFDSKDYEILSI